MGVKNTYILFNSFIILSLESILLKFNTEITSLLVLPWAVGTNYGFIKDIVYSGCKRN